MPAGMSPIQFSGYFRTNAGIRTSKATPPQVKPAIPQGPSGDHFALSTSNPSSKQPRFSGFTDRNDDYWHGDPDGENRYCSGNTNRSGRCDGTSEDESDDTPRNRLSSLLPEGLREPIRRAGHLLQGIGGAAQDGANMIGDVVADQIEGYAEHQAQLNDEYSDIALHSYIPLMAKALNAVPQKDGQSEIAYADQVLTLARRPTPQQEDAWEDALHRATQKGEMEAWQAKHAIPLYNLAARLQHKLVTTPQMVQRQELEAQRQETRERDFRDLPLVAEHRHRHNRRTERPRTDNNNDRRPTGSDSTQREEQLVRREPEFPHFSEGRGMNYRISASGREAVYEDGSRAPLRRR